MTNGTATVQCVCLLLLLHYPSAKTLSSYLLIECAVCGSCSFGKPNKFFAQFNYLTGAYIVCIYIIVGGMLVYFVNVMCGSSIGLKVLKVAILAEKYAVDYTWYVDTILNLIRIAGDYVSEEVGHGDW